MTVKQAYEQIKYAIKNRIVERVSDVSITYKGSLITTIYNNGNGTYSFMVESGIYYSNIAGSEKVDD